MRRNGISTHIPYHLCLMLTSCYICNTSINVSLFGKETSWCKQSCTTLSLYDTNKRTWSLRHLLPWHNEHGPRIGDCTSRALDSEDPHVPLICWRSHTDFTGHGYPLDLRIDLPSVIAPTLYECLSKFLRAIRCFAQCSFTWQGKPKAPIATRQLRHWITSWCCGWSRMAVYILALVGNELSIS